MNNEKTKILEIETGGTEWNTLVRNLSLEDLEALINLPELQTERRRATLHILKRHRSQLLNFFDWDKGMPIKAECSDSTKGYWPFGCICCKNMKFAENPVYDTEEDLNLEKCGPQECMLGHPTIKAVIRRFNNPHVNRKSYLAMYRTPTPEDLK